MSEASVRARAAWSAGNWPELAKLITDPGRRTVERAGVTAGQEVLDVGAGNGNVAIPAAQAGARVIALDPTPELFESGRARAAEAGVEIEWVEGEAMDLPYEDGRFDAVLSNFGAMFAPVHARAAAELSRVAKPDGVVVMTTWVADHMYGRLFVEMAPFMPPAPDGVEPPFLWGDEEHVRAVFAPTGRTVTIERDVSPIEFASPDVYLEFLSTVLGPVAANRPRLEQEGRFDDLRDAMRGVFTSFNEADDGSFRASPQYLAITVR
jgi:2-polyprenyl-6-hydroxyphenyl methylase/3-demethylubiquinone-9 3-methyltransferase